MLNSRDFCTLYSAFYGEQIDCLEQLKYAVFDGHELFEFVKYVEQNLANGAEQSSSNCNIPLVNGSAYRDELLKKTESMEEFAKQNYEHKEYYEGLLNGLRNMRAHIKNLYRKHYR